MVYSAAAVLHLQFVLLVMLFRPCNMFCTFTLPLSAVCVQCPVWLFFFCSSLISCFPGMLLRYCLSDFEMVSVAPVITGTAFVSYILHVLYLYCKFLIFYNIPGFFLYHTSYTFLFHYHGL